MPGDKPATTPRLGLAARLVQPRLAGVRTSLSRMSASAPAAVQVAAATAAAYAFSLVVLHHSTPVLTATTTIATLGFARDARPIRVVETAVAITIGIAVSDVMLAALGRGTWQVLPFVFMALLVGRLLSSSPAFAAASATQAVLVLFLPEPAGGFFARSLDGLVGGCAALAATALVPRDPLRLVRDDAVVAIGEVQDSLERAASGLRHGSIAAVADALEVARSTQPLLDAWGASLETAAGVAEVSPRLRRRRPSIADQQRVKAQIDLASRNARVLLRRLVALPPQQAGTLSALLGELSTVLEVLGASAVARDQSVGLLRSIEARRHLLVLGAALTNEWRPAPDAPPDPVLVGLIRPLVIDLLMATGCSHEQARESLPPLA